MQPADDGVERVILVRELVVAAQPGPLRVLLVLTLDGVLGVASPAPTVNSQGLVFRSVMVKRWQRKQLVQEHTPALQVTNSSVKRNAMVVHHMHSVAGAFLSKTQGTASGMRAYLTEGHDTAQGPALPTPLPLNTADSHQARMA